MPIDIKQLVTERLGENYDLHERYINRTLVAVQRTIGFDKIYANAQGAYLYDVDGKDYLDFLSGYSVFNIGRNHPAVKQAIRDMLDLDLPNMVQMDCSLLSGVLAEALVKRHASHLDAVFFCNSGAEAMEGAIKFARAATGRAGFVSLESAFHGLSMGALSVMGNAHFQEGFGPVSRRLQARADSAIFPRSTRLLATGQIAARDHRAGAGQRGAIPEGRFFRGSAASLPPHGTLLVSDEMQTGLGRTGKWLGFPAMGLEPDIITMAKS